MVFHPYLDLWHQQSILTNTFTAHWILSLFGTIHCKSERRLCIKIPGQQFLQYIDRLVGQEQPYHIESHLDFLICLYIVDVLLFFSRFEVSVIFFWFNYNFWFKDACSRWISGCRVINELSIGTCKVLGIWIPFWCKFRTSFSFEVIIIPSSYFLDPTGKFLHLFSL